MLNILPSAVMTHHVGQNNGTGPSPRILADVVGQATDPPGQSRLIGHAEDFLGHFVLAALGSGAAGVLDRYSYWGDAGASIAPSSTSPGKITIATAATDNHEFWLKFGGIGFLNGQPLQFEVAADFPSSTGTVFVGLTDAGAQATDFVSDADALKDANHIGFLVTSGNITFVHRADGQAVVEVFDETTLGTTSGRHKLGFQYGPSIDGMLRVYVDGVLKGSKQASELTTASLPASTDLLAPVFGLKNTAGAITSLGLDWWYAYHLAS